MSNSGRPNSDTGRGQTIKRSRDRLTAPAETNLYRILQEALNNTAKHARATKVEVLLENRGEDVVMISRTMA